MDDADDDGQAGPPGPAATPQASAADAPAPTPDPATAASAPAEPNQSAGDAPVAADAPPPAPDPAPADTASPAPTQSAADTPAPADVPAPDPTPVDSAAPEPNQSAANTPAPLEPNICIEPSQSDPATSGAPADGGSQTDGASSPDAPAGSTNGAVPGAGSAPGETSLADSGAQPSGTGNAAQLTDLHYDWLKRLHGSDVREVATEPGGAPSPSPAANELSFMDKAKVALQVAGEVTGVSGVVRTVEQKASAAVDTAKQVGSIVAEHPGEAIAGLAYGAVQGFTPGGVVAPSPDPKSKAFELARGVGMMAGGVGAAALGVGEEVVGTAADLTGIGAPVGVLLNVGGVVSGATAVTSELAGAATIANAMSMGGDGPSSSSSGGSSGGTPPTTEASSGPSVKADATEQARRFPPDKVNKVLVGERVPNPASPNGMSNEVVGGHSPSIKSLPNYEVEELAKNADGTTVVKFSKQFPDGKLSKIKKSTLAPNNWTDKMIEDATQAVADTPAVATRARDGATLYRETVNGVQWEVIRDQNGIITSSYPTGGVPTNNF